jgi:type VI secretion system secreted protein VgrG
MSDFSAAIPVILQHEGGWVDDPDDPGGATNYGITLGWYQANVNPNATADTIKNLTSDEASQLYEQYWWGKYDWGQISDQQMATKIFDMAINVSAARAHKFVQTALNQCGQSVTVDGALGPASFAAINSNPPGLMDAVIVQQKTYYSDLAAEKPKLAKFLNDWLKRANWPGPLVVDWDPSAHVALKRAHQ